MFVVLCCSSWLPTSPVLPPVLLPVLQPRVASQALPSCQADMSSSAIACGCTEDQPCTAGCPNMQNSSSALRTPLAAVAAANGQTAKQLAGQGVEVLCTSGATLESGATGQTGAATGKTFSRHKRQPGSIGKRKADLSWLLGADEPPTSGSRHQQLSYQDQPWASVSGDAVDPQPQSASNMVVDAGPKLQNGVVTW